MIAKPLPNLTIVECACRIVTAWGSPTTGDETP